MKFLLASAARATVGARSGQEDSYRVWPAEGDAQPDPESPGLLAVLADGMGGHTGGAIAGETACAAFADAFVASASPYAERLHTALHAGNEALAQGVERNAALRGMGCTLVAAWFDSSGMRWTSVGDSLLLLYRFPEVIRLNADHSLGSLLDEQARQNIITASEAKSHLNRNALRSALTGSHIELIDMHGEPFAIRAGDWIVLASDGICSLAGDEIADVIGRYRHEPPSAMAEALIDAVLAKGVAGQDNATVVVVRVEAAPGAAVDEVTTRVVRRSTMGGAAAARAKGKTTRSLLSSALDVSPAVWLGVAAGLLLIAVVLALAGPPHKRQTVPEATRPPPESQQIPEASPPERRALLPADPAAPAPPPSGAAPPDGQSAEDPSAAGAPSQAAPPLARPSQARKEGPDGKKKDKRERPPLPHATPN